MLFIFITLLFIVFVTGQSLPTRVDTEQGTVVGFKATDGNYLTFYDVPYAGVRGRYKAASPPPKYKEDFQAVNRSIICAQPTPEGVAGVEDCLTLSVFTKNVTSNLPIIVYLNGELYSNTINTPQYSFKSLVEADVVFITVNYRLSIFGFLCLGVEEAPGNAGLKDVIQALKWIKANGRHFGGNPDNIVLMGHGSGAAMVDIITMSPQSKDLVHKAIALSGSALAPCAIAYDPVEYAKALAIKLNFTKNDQQELARFFEKADGNTLMKTINEFEFTNNSVLFAPCVENTELPGAVLEDAPINLLRSGKYQKIPYIAVYVENEGTTRAYEALNGKWLEKMQQSFDEFLPADLGFPDKTTKESIGKDLRMFYFEDKPVDNSSIVDYLNYEGDILVTLPVIRGVKERAKTTGNGSVYLLHFGYETSTRDRLFKDLANGPGHGDVLKCIFDSDSTSVDEEAKKYLQNRFIAFANTGVPNKAGDLMWLPVEEDEILYFSIYGKSDNVLKSSPLSNPFNNTMVYWDQKVSKYYLTPKQLHYIETGGMGAGLIVFIVLLCIVIVISAMFVYRKREKLRQRYSAWKQTMQEPEPE